MKTRIVKMFALPLAAFALASAGAVSTNESAKTKTDTLAITGYIHSSSPTNCDPVEVDCNTVSGNTCMYGSYQVWRKQDPSAPKPCLLQLFKN